MADDFFLCGILVATLAAATAYFYQSLITAKLWNDMQEEFGPKPVRPWANQASRVLILGVTIPLITAAYGLFAFGAFKTLHAMELLSNLPKGV